MHVEGNEGLLRASTVSQELYPEGEHILAEVSYEQEGADEGVVHDVCGKSLHSGYMALNELDGVLVDGGKVHVVPLGLFACEDDGASEAADGHEDT